MESVVFEKYTGGQEPIMPLLLLGDESEAMVGRYLPRAEGVYVGRHDGSVVAVCVVTSEPDGWIEIKNLAVAPSMRRRGIGRAMLAYVESRHHGHRFKLGTGATPSTLRFYRGCGYRYSHRVADFFTTNYDHPIVEEGVTLRDMLYPVKET